MITSLITTKNIVILGKWQRKQLLVCSSTGNLEFSHVDKISCLHKRAEKCTSNVNKVEYQVFNTVHHKRCIYFKVFQPKKRTDKKGDICSDIKATTGVLTKAGDLSGAWTCISYLQLALTSWRMSFSSTVIVTFYPSPRKLLVPLYPGS